MSDEGEFAERWRAPRDAASVPADDDASTGSEAAEYATRSHEPHETYGTEPRAFAAWDTPDPADSPAEGRVVFSTPAPEDRLEFSLPDHDGLREGAAETPAAPAAEGRLDFSSSDYLTYDVSQGGAAETSSAPGEGRLEFSSSDYLTHDVSQGGAAEAPAAPVEDRLDFSPSSYLSYDSYEAPAVAEPVAEEPPAPAEGRLDFSPSSYLSYDSYDRSYDTPAPAVAEPVADEPPAPAEGRLEFSAPDYLSYDVSPAAEAAVPDPPAPAEDRSVYRSSYTSDYTSDYTSSRDYPSSSDYASSSSDHTATPSATPASSWEGSLFDGGADTEAGDDRYVPARPSGPGTPPKPGTPSSGNLRLPDWMREESGYGRHAAAEAGRVEEEDDEEKGRSRFALFAVVALVVALVAVGSVYLLRSGDESPAAAPPAGDGKASPGAQPGAGQRLPARKALRRFPGTPTPPIGRYTDVHAGISYPRLGAPWQAATKQNRLGQLGWSGQQVVVTERQGSQLWYGQVLSGTLGPGEMSMYGGPGTEEATAAAYARHVEERFYGFQHRTRPFASQPLTVSGRKGWLVSSYLQYQRPGVQATGELVVTAVIDTGRPSPAVLFLAIPNTHRRLWPDVNYFLTNLRVAG